MPIDLEIPVFSPSSALHAQALGAQRIELNAKGSYGVGGTTPTLADLAGITKWIMVPLRIMIRPRGKPSDEAPDFVYTDDEFETMLADVEAFSRVLRKDRGDGFVFGVLRPEGNDGRMVVDVERNSALVAAAGGLPCSFHRAFDEVVRDHGVGDAVERGARELVECGFVGVLTSGGPGTAADNKPTLARIAKVAAAAAAARSKKFEVIVGGGVRSANVRKVVAGLGPGVWAHSSCFRGQCEEGEVDDEEAMGILEVLSETVV